MVGILVLLLSTYGKVRGKNIVAPFFQHGVCVYIHLVKS